MTGQPVVHGVLPVVATPFTASWEIDAQGIRHELDWLYANGADGVVVAMVSEITRLSLDEREHLGAVVCSANDGRGPVVLSVGTESTPLSVRLARHATAVGATALMANPPLLSHSDDAGIVGYYEAILAAAPLPLVVQDASGYVGARLALDVQVELLRRHGPDRVMFKPEATPIGPGLSELLDATGGRARVFEGSGGLALVDSYRRGGIVGTMPGADLVWAIVTLWHAIRAGEDGRAYQITGALAPLLAPLDTLDAYVATEKYLLARQGVLASERRRDPNAYRLDPMTRAEVDRVFDRLRSTVAEGRGVLDELEELL